MTTEHLPFAGLRDAFLRSQFDLDKRHSAYLEIRGTGDGRPGSESWLFREKLFEALLDCKEPVPRLLCGPLGIPEGATYGQAAWRALVREGWQLTV